MQHITDDFLLNMAEVSATLIGLFLVGVFFFAETGVLQRSDVPRLDHRYIRSGTRITLIVFAIPLGLSLTLVALEPFWSRILFAVLSLILVAANVDSVLRVRGVASKTLLINEVVTTSMTVVLVALPWVLGGLHPTREDLTWAILLSFAAGFLSISAVALSVLDVARGESTVPAEEEAGSEASG